jgi:hypothetical protein
MDRRANMAVDVLNGADDMDAKKNDPEQVLSGSDSFTLTH